MGLFRWFKRKKLPHEEVEEMVRQASHLPKPPPPPKARYVPTINREPIQRQRIEQISPLDVVAGAVILDSILHEHHEPPCPHHESSYNSGERFFEGGESGGGGASRDFDADVSDRDSYDSGDNFDSGDSGCDSGGGDY